MELLPGVAPSGAESPEQTHLLFRLGDFTLALPLAGVRAVVRPSRFTAVPFAAPWLRGVTAVSGEVVSVVDLGTFAGGEPAGFSPGARLLVTHWAGLSAGLLVDRVTGLAPRPATLSPVPVASGPLAAHGRGAHTVDGEAVFVVDPQRLFHDPALHAYQGTQTQGATTGAPIDVSPLE